jgi:hypothetical protein
MGTHVIHLKAGDTVASIARISAADLKEAEIETDTQGKQSAEKPAKEPPAPEG